MEKTWKSKYKKDFEIKGYDGENLPNDFSFGRYKSKINMLKRTSEPVVYMYHQNDMGIDLFGKIQCNNMIPVPDSELIKIDINAEADVAYKTLMQKQINYVRKKETTLLKRHINPVYNNRIQNRMEYGYIRKATPDFALLEIKCEEWVEIHKEDKL